MMEIAVWKANAMNHEYHASDYFRKTPGHHSIVDSSGRICSGGGNDHTSFDSRNDFVSVPPLETREIVYNCDFKYVKGGVSLHGQEGDFFWIADKLGAGKCAIKAEYDLVQVLAERIRAQAHLLDAKERENLVIGIFEIPTFPFEVDQNKR